MNRIDESVVVVVIVRKIDISVRRIYRMRNKERNIGIPVRTIGSVISHGIRQCVRTNHIYIHYKLPI